MRTTAALPLLALALTAACAPAPTWQRETAQDAGDLHAVWARADDDAWAVGPTSAVLHWDGVRWSVPAAELPPGSEFSGVWGSAADDVWFAGAGGYLVHWDGRAFTKAQAPTQDWLCAIAGASATDVWAVGGTSVLHWDGAVWSSEYVPMDSGELLSVWESPGREVWVAGTGGAVFRKSAGGAFARVESGALSDVLGVWGSADGDVWLVGSFGTLLHWDGARVVASDAASGVNLASVWGRAADDVWAVGAEILHWDGRSWSVQARPESGLSGVGGTANAPRAVGPAGTILRYGR